jgi:hypothetical protein
MNGAKELKNFGETNPIQGAIVEAAIRWRATQFVLARLGSHARCSNELQTMAEDYQAILFALIDTAVLDSLPNASILKPRRSPLPEAPA